MKTPAEASREHPESLGDAKRVVADGGLVVMHLHVTHNRKHLGWSVFEIIRMENGKAVEHWELFRRCRRPGGELALTCVGERLRST